MSIKNLQFLQFALYNIDKVGCRYIQSLKNCDTDEDDVKYLTQQVQRISTNANQTK